MSDKNMRVRVQVGFLVEINPFDEYERYIQSLEENKSFSVYNLHIWELDLLRYLFQFPSSCLLSFEFVWCPFQQLASLHPEILIFSYNQYQMEKVLFEVQKHPPSVLILLSDEWKRDTSLHQKTKHIPLVLRQHSMPGLPSNVQVLPTGFMQGMFGKHFSLLPAPFSLGQDSSLLSPLPPISLPPISARRHFWSFVGNIGNGSKQLHRMEMKTSLEAHKENFPGYMVTCPAHETRKWYMNSVFVMCPRGNVSMDCFRNFEALLCGAIPVVSGCSQEEFEQTFSYLNLDQKKTKNGYCWIFREKWEDAIQTCKSLLLQESTNNQNILQQMQDQNIQWWKCFIESIQGKILNALHVHPKSETISKETFFSPTSVSFCCS